MMVEFILFVLVDDDNTFEVIRKIQEPVWICNSILTVDYNYRPWPRTENLLWQ